MTELQVRAESGVGYGKLLPHMVGFDWSTDFLETGGGTFGYQRGGKNAELLTPKARVIAYVDGVEPRNGRFALQEAREDVVGEGDDTKTIVKHAFVDLRATLAGIKIHPKAGKRADEPWKYNGTSPGGVLGDVWSEAKTRGRMTAYTRDWTGALTSADTPWVSAVETEFEVGTSFLDVLFWLQDQGMINFWFEGLELRVVNADEGVVDRFATAPKVIFNRGRDLIAGTQAMTVRDQAEHILVQGEAGRFVTRDSQEPRFGEDVWEDYVPATNITNPVVLQHIAWRRLQEVHLARRAKAYEVKGSCKWVVHRDILLGDWGGVRDATKGLPERVRLRRADISVDDSGVLSTRIAVNDWLSDRDIYLTRRVEALTKGGHPKGTGAAPVPGADRIAPAAPNAGAAPGLTTETYDPPSAVGGGARSLVTVTCALPTTDADSEPLTDFLHLLYQWGYTGRAGWADVVDPNTTAKITNLDPGRTVRVRVRAVDTFGNRSAPTTEATIVAAPDFGAFRAYDSTTGEEILDTRNGARLRAPSRFTIGSVPGAGGARGLGVAATTNGIEIDEEFGLRLWNGGGSRTAWLDATTGDIDINGNAIIQGFVSIGGDVDISGSVTIAGVITANALNVNTVNTQHIVNSAITEVKNGTASTSTRVLANLAVLEGKIGIGSVTNTRLGDNATDGRVLAGSSIQTYHLTGGLAITGTLTTGGGVSIGAGPGGTSEISVGSNAIYSSGGSLILIGSFISLTGNGWLNGNWTYTGTFGAESVRASKAAIRPVKLEAAKALLAVEPKTFKRADAWKRARTREVRPNGERWGDKPDATRRAGWIAEDVEATGVEEVLIRDESGALKGVQSDGILAHHHALIRDLYEQVDVLRASFRGAAERNPL